MDRKDEIIRLQAEIMSGMTRRGLSGISDDFWGDEKPSEPSLPKGAEAIPEKKPEEKPAEEPAESIDDLKAELDGYIGLDSVKKEVKNLINLALVEKMRLENGLPSTDMSLHMVFSGNPGTGKTMIARFMARVYRALGLLSRGQLVETDRNGLVAGYVGQTAIKTAEVVGKAIGGVLFIDEAYSLSSGGGNDYGREAIETLLKLMEDNRGDLVVIVAGYSNLMFEFISSNPGLQSRFNRYLVFEDYTLEQMAEIFKFQCKKGRYELSPDAADELRARLEAESADPGFGNARGVRNLFENALTAQANRLAAMESVVKDDLILLTAEDIKAIPE